jgi:hypothetical protein
MSQFFKKFLSEDAARLNADNGRFLALGAFGKHPGWDDHIEDLGLETESLTLAKTVLYVRGVGGQIDTGAWEKLKPEERLEGFDHLFLWQRSGQFLLGRLWSSSDGKGRTRYPMVVCAHCLGVSVAWALAQLLPKLNELEKACTATTQAAEVRLILDRARTDLRSRLPGAGPPHPFAPASPEALQRFVADAALGSAQQGWFRLLYHLDNQMASYAAGKFKGDLSGLRSQQMRVPLASPTLEQGFLLWTRFLGSRLDRDVPVFLAATPTNTWLDVVVGEPSSHDFFGLRATPAALPLITEVPYEISEQFQAQSRAALADFQSGKESFMLGQSASSGGAAEGGGWISVTQRWFKSKTSKLWLILCAAGLLMAAGAAMFLVGGRSANQLRTDRAAVTPNDHPAAAAGLAKPVNRPLAAAQSVTSAPAISGSKPSAAPPPISRPEPPAAPVDASVSPHAADVALLAPRPTAEPVNREVVPVPMPTVPQTVPAVPAPDPTSPPPVVVASAVEQPPVQPTGQSDGPRRLLTNSLGMVLIWIASLPGTAQGGYVGRYEVTQKEFEQVMGANPSLSKNPLQPVESVTWDEATAFCDKLTAAEKKIGILPEGFGYELPTQTQWEFFLGDSTFEEAVTSRNALRDSPAPVGSRAPNQYGLYDVLGNVWEFCSDGGASDKLLKGTAYNNRKLYGEKASDWKPLERTTPRRLAEQARMPDAGFRCVVAPVALADK